jgi:hypothetical protein
MSWFRQKSSSTKPDYTGLQLQTSVNTLPIPMQLPTPPCHRARSLNPWGTWIAVICSSSARSN